jgi:hypothetical protein
MASACNRDPWEEPNYSHPIPWAARMPLVELACAVNQRNRTDSPSVTMRDL